MSAGPLLIRVRRASILPTVLYQNGKTLLHQQGSIKDNETAAQGQHIVACPDFQELSDTFLYAPVHISFAASSYCPIG